MMYEFSIECSHSVQLNHLQNIQNEFIEYPLSYDYLSNNNVG